MSPINHHNFYGRALASWTINPREAFWLKDASKYPVFTHRKVGRTLETKSRWLLSNSIDADRICEKEEKWLISSFCYAQPLSNHRKCSLLCLT